MFVLMYLPSFLRAPTGVNAPTGVKRRIVPRVLSWTFDRYFFGDGATYISNAILRRPR